MPNNPPTVLNFSEILNSNICVNMISFARKIHFLYEKISIENYKKNMPDLAAKKCLPDLVFDLTDYSCSMLPVTH